MSINALSSNLAILGGVTHAGIVNALRFLKDALDQVEEPNGYWHNASIPALAELTKWDEQQGTFNKGVLESPKLAE